MYLTEKQAKTVKWISYVVQILLIIGIIVLSTVCKRSAKKIEQQTTMIEQLVNERDSLQRLCKQLGNEDCITINCSVNIKAPNIMGAQNINSDAVAKTVASITRQELLDLKNPKDTINDIKLDTLTTNSGAKIIAGKKIKQ